MRTTVDLPDELLRRARVRAADEGTSLTQPLADGLRLRLDAAGGSGHWPRFAGLCRQLNLRGNDVPGAHLAALALEERAELVTLDRGFGRFPALRWRCLLDD